jgi:hypothetical protein
VIESDLNRTTHAWWRGARRVLLESDSLSGLRAPDSVVKSVALNPAS